MKLLRLVFIVFLVFGPLAAEIYTWVDKKGVRHYSDVFPGRGENIIDLQVFDTTQPPPPPKPVTPDTAAADTTIRSNKTVLMYIEPDCPPCDQARAFFKNSDIKFIEMDISSGAAAASAFTRAGGTEVPLIVIGNIKISGFNQTEIINALSVK